MKSHSQMIVRTLFSLLVFFVTTSTMANPTDPCTRFRGQLVPMLDLATHDVDLFCFVGDPTKDFHLGIIDLASLEATDHYARSQAILAFLREVQPDAATGESAARIANPAWAFCEKQGGQIFNYTRASAGPDGDQYGQCRFSDGSMVDQWTLFRMDQPLALLLYDLFPR